MDPVNLSAAECSSDGLQLLLDKWRLQEDELQVFEESLKEVKSMIYQPVQENLKVRKPETVLQQTMFVLGEDKLGKSVQDGIFCVTSAQNITSNENNFGHSLRMGSYEEEDVEMPVVTNEESIEEYEKRIWGTVWKDEVLLNDDSGEGSYPCVVEAPDTSSENHLQRARSEMVRLSEVVLVVNDLERAENAEEKEPRPESLFHLDFEGPSVRASHLTSVSNDVFITSDLEVRPQSSIRMFSKDVGMSHSFERDRQIGTICLEDLGIRLENMTFPLVCEEVESLEMAVNLVSPGSWSPSLSNEEFSNINELSKQRASFVESIMASEAQRQMEREKEQLRRNEALKQEEEAVANMEKALQNQLQLVQEEKHISIKQQECWKQKKHEEDQRLEELQRELESSNAVLKKLIENWESFGKEVELNSESVEEYLKSRRLEEEKRNTAAQRIARAFRKRRCKILYNYCTSIQKVVRGFLCRRRVQKLKDHRCKMMRILATAIEEGNLSMLIESSAEAQKVGLYKELDLMKLEFARRKITRLHVSDETFQFQALPQVQALFMEAKSMGLEEGKLKELFKSMAKSRNAALEHLTQATKVGNRDEFESCLKTALALGLEEQVDAIEDSWKAAEAEVSGWLRQVASTWGIGLKAVSEKVKEAQRLGLTTLVETVQATVAKKENIVLAGLETSITNGSLKTFHEWLRSAKLFDMKEVVEEYSARFNQRISEVQKQLMQATVRSYDKKCLKQLVLEGTGLGLETEMAMVVRHIRWKILMFVKELVNHTKESINRGGDFLGKWRELQWRGNGFGIGAHALKDLMESIENNVILEHTKMRRSIVAVFKCDLMGFPVSNNCAMQRAFLNVKTLTLGYFSSNSSSEAHEPAKNHCSKIGMKSGTRWITTVPLITHSISWYEVDKLRGRWKHQFSQPFLKMLASKSPTSGGLGIAKPQQRDREGLQWKNSKYYSRIQTRYVRTEEEILEDVVVLDRGNKDGDGDDEYWHTPWSPRHCGVQPLATCTLTRKMLEVSAHCNRTELGGIVKLSITHKDLTSLGVGILGQWCPKLQIFMINENKLNTLKGAFHGCEGLLEYVLVKDNLLNDFKGLELLQNLKVLFLGGNFISYIGPDIEVYMGDPEVVDMTVEEGPFAKTSTTTPRTLCRSWQGTPRFLEDRNDPRGCLTSRNSHLQLARSLWPKLKKLCLANNRIARVWELGSLCSNLEVLDLGSNELVTLGGCEGRGLANLKNLRLLDVGQNKIKGRSLWKALNHCPLLVSLVASRNRLTELPTHLGSVMLREIWLNGNSITRLACKAWLPNLQRVYLQDNLIDNLESFWGCPSLEVLDISFNNVADLSQLNHLSCLRRLRTLQMNDNPISDQEEHVDKVLEAVPWLIELDNEPIQDSFREKSIKSIFLKNMEVAGIEYLYEKTTQAEKLFLSFGNPKDVARQWLRNNSSFIDQCDWTLLAASSRHWGNTKSEVVDTNIIEVMEGKAKGAIMWAAIFDLHRMVGTNPILKAQLTSPMGSSLHPLESLPCHSTTDENWNCLACQEMFEIHRKSCSWSKETSLQKEFLVQESKFGTSTIDKRVSNFGKEDVMAESNNVDQYLAEHLEYTDYKYQNLYKENVEYRTEIEAQLLRVRRLQALGRGMLVRKSRMRMQKLAMDALMAREAQQLLEKQRFQSSVLRIQAAWKRWIFKKSVRSATKLQAFWRGFVIRKRFQQVLSRLRYIDDDDFEYIAVDENEFELDPIFLEDECFLLSKLCASKELGIGNLCEPETGSTDEIPAIKLENEYHGPSLSESHGTRLPPSVNKQGGEMEVVALSECQSSHIEIQCEKTEGESQSVKRGIDSCSCPYLSKRFGTLKLASKPFIDDVCDSLSPSEAKASGALQSKDSKSSLKETQQSASHPQLQQFTTEFGPQAHNCMKELRAEKMKASIAEIAKDWGFKNEKTAEAFLKSKAKLLKKLEKEKATHQGAQSRLDLFKARSKEALAHSTPQHTHFKKAAPRQPLKVEKESVPNPYEDVSLVEETFESRHPPATLPALIPHARQTHFKKGKLRKSCPAAWAPPSTGKFAKEERDHVPDVETINWDGWQSWRAKVDAHVWH